MGSNPRQPECRQPSKPGFDLPAETLRWLGLIDPAVELETRAAQEAPATSVGVAQALVAELGCAVVAMRYPVIDDFAVGFADALYDPDDRMMAGFLAGDLASTRATGSLSMGSMRLLVLGGTSFLSKQVARDALERGHEVVCAARGQSGPAPEGAQLVVIDRDQPGALEPLTGERFDAVVDVATGALGWVLDALDVLAERARHWTFVSSINAYADTATLGQSTDAALHEPVSVTDHLDLFTEMTVELHGGIKVASENAVRARMGERAFVVRPGIISGPGDGMDRFGYWASRFARGGRAVVPDTPHQPIQHIDVRDLAAWIVTAGEQRLGGTYDAIGPVLKLGPVLRETAELVGAADLELVPIDPDTLTEAGINPWGGPTSMPLWLPVSKHGLVAHDPTPALAAGLAPRPLADTVHTVLADEHTRGLDRPRTAGLTPAEERALLERAGTTTARRGRDR